MENDLIINSESVLTGMVNCGVDIYTTIKDFDLSVYVLTNNKATIKNTFIVCDDDSTSFSFKTSAHAWDRISSYSDKNLMHVSIDHEIVIVTKEEAALFDLEEIDLFVRNGDLYISKFDIDNYELHGYKVAK